MRLLSALLLALLAASGAALADPPRDRPPHPSHARPKDDEVARRAQQMNGGGRVLSVQPTEGGHRVKLLKNGEVRVVTVPEQEQH